MALCPFAVIRLLHPENDAGGEPSIVPTQLILHTAVSKASSLYGYFSRADVKTESTFYIAQDGTLEQYMDTERQADAQFDGNAHGVSVETWDDADPNNTPLNDKQVATFLRLARWLNDVHGIPLHICAGPQSPGQGYHSLFSQWAKDGHTCPNPLRIAQFHHELLPALAGHEGLRMDAEVAAAFDAVRTDINSTKADVDRGVTDIGTLIGEFRKFAARPVAAGGIDLDELADKVADKLAARLAS